MGQVVFVDSCGDAVSQSPQGYVDWVSSQYELSNISTSGNWSANILSGRNGGNCYLTRGGNWMVKYIPESQRVVVGFVFMRYAEELSGSGGISILAVGDASNQMMLAIGNLDGSGTRFLLYRGTSELVSQSDFTFPPNVWLYVETDVSVSSEYMFCTVRVNGVAIIEFVGNTDPNGTAKISWVRFGFSGLLNAGQVQRRRYYDDIYINRLDSPNEGEDGFLGDVRVIPRMPNADIQTQFERSGGSTNHENISETGEGAPNDSTYVRGEPGDQDLYGLQSIQEAAGYTPRKVHAVQATARVIAEGEVQPFRTIIKSGDVESKSPQSFADASGEPRYIGLHCLDKDPETGLPWTVSRANQIQAGFEVEGGE